MKILGGLVTVGAGVGGGMAAGPAGAIVGGGVALAQYLFGLFHVAPASLGSFLSALSVTKPKDQP